MLKLDPIPHDGSSLRAALVGALAPLGLSAEAVTVEGEFPSLAALRLVLTGGRFHRGLLSAGAAGRAAQAVGKGADGGAKQPLFFAREVEVTAAPAYLEALPFTLSLRGNDATFGVVGAGPGATLTLSSCGAGTLDISVKHAELEAAITSLAREAAEKKGAELKSVHVEITSEGPRALQLRAVAEAKAMFFTAKLIITGRVDVSDDLEVRLSGLACTGDGMIANLAAGAIRPRLAEVEGRSLALRSLIPNLRTLVLDAESGLRIRAEFGA